LITVQQVPLSLLQGAPVKEKLVAEEVTVYGLGQDKGGFEVLLPQSVPSVAYTEMLSLFGLLM
jgi:hypothetical protein